MKNKKIMIPVLVAAFLLASVGTIFVLKQIKGQPDSNDSQQSEEIAATEEKSKDEEEKKTDDSKEEEPKKEPTIEEKNKKQVELIRSCNKIVEEKNAELRKEDQKYSSSLQKINSDSNCNSNGCTTRESVENTHSESINKINIAYAEKYKKAGCRGNI
ncbi:hypothetical protein IK110_04090 [Candidatus Saccharibacteria bacterium]|nr:hypothetical protein [Candidatus Saccharibacteria bacterium]